MAFIAKIDSISPQCNDGATITFLVGVTFSDSVTGFTVSKTYAFPVNTTQAIAVAAITADGITFKTGLATISNLQTKVGAEITI